MSEEELDAIHIKDLLKQFILKYGKDNAWALVVTLKDFFILDKKE